MDTDREVKETIMSKSKYGIKLTAAVNEYRGYEYARKESKSGFDPIRQKRYAKLAPIYRSNAIDLCADVTEWIDRAEKGCRARKIEAADVLKACIEIEERLSITKKALNGCSFDVNLHGQQFPNAYRGQPESTWFTLEYHSGNWYLSSVRRGTARVSHCVDAYLTEEAEAAIVNEYRAW